MIRHDDGKFSNKEQMLATRSIKEKSNHAMFAENFINCFEHLVTCLVNEGFKLFANTGVSDTEYQVHSIYDTVEKNIYDYFRVKTS